MQVLSVKVLKGPSIYSFRPVVKIRIDLGKYKNIPSCSLGDFNDRLLELLPGLNEHHCSSGRPGGFVERLRQGTYLAHIYEHVVLELQCQAGYGASFGKARSSGKDGIYEVIVGFRVAKVAVEASFIAEKLLAAILERRVFAVAAAVEGLKTIGANWALGPSTAAIQAAAERRGIPVSRVGDENMLILGYGVRQQRVWTTITGKTSALAMDLVGDKELTKHLLAENGIPVPNGEMVTELNKALTAAAKLNGLVVVKPVSGNQGKGVSLRVSGQAEIERAFDIACQYDQRVLIEEYIKGREYRLCVVNGKMAAAAERIPAYVIGDGQQTIAQLVELVNADPKRGEGHEKPLTKIKIDAVGVMVLAKQNMTPQTIPPAGQIVYIRENANLSTGGTAVDVTDIVHPDNILLAERAARLVNLDVAGIDIVAEDIAKPITDGRGAIIEINAAPGIRMHHYPSAGKARDVAGRIIDYLFPDGQSGRIPIIAITGTNGKTTVARLMSHIWQLAGYRSGMTSTDGIFINGRKIVNGDATGPASARIVLTDPAVEVAVLETARGGIIRNGLAFDRCDVGIITNISEDHLGQDGIEDLEDLAYVKSLVLETVKPDGMALINADDEYAVSLVSRVRAEIVYFSTMADNIIVRRHLGIGGRAFFVKDNIIWASCGNLARQILPVSDIPLTLGGIAHHNIQNALIAAAACYCLKLPLSHIRRGLATFEDNPGRLNIIKIANFRVCVDYGHNPAGYRALINTVRRMGAGRLVGVIAAPGDRRDDVIINIGKTAGQGFDYIYIKEDCDLRGRQPGETAGLLCQGATEAGLSRDKIEIIRAEQDAVRQALQKAKPGDLIVIFYEQYELVMDTVNEFCREYPEDEKWDDRPDAGQVIVAGAKQI